MLSRRGHAASFRRSFPMRESRTHRPVVFVDEIRMVAPPEQMNLPAQADEPAQFTCESEGSDHFATTSEELLEDPLTCPTSTSAGRKTAALQDEGSVDCLKLDTTGREKKDGCTTTASQDEGSLDCLDLGTAGREEKDGGNRSAESDTWRLQVKYRGLPARKKKKPSLVSYLSFADQEPLDSDENWSFLPPKARPTFHAEVVQRCPHFSVEHSIPRFLGKQQQLIFSRSEFQTAVIDRIEHYARTKERCAPNGFLNSSSFKTKILSNHATYPTSYLLQAKGPRSLLDELQKETQWFIKYRISLCNLHGLLDDGESLVFDIQVNAYEEVGWVTMESPAKTKLRKSAEGVWVLDVKRGCSLANAMGGEKAFQSGCAILAVNEKACRSPEKLIDLFKQEKTANPRGQIKLALCLSKYADLSELGQAKIVPRRLDGEPYDQGYYESLTLQQWIPSVPVSIAPATSSSSWVEYPPIDAPPPTALPDTGIVTEEQKAEAITKILGDENNVEVDLIITATENLGAKIFSQRHNHRGGIWVYDFKSEGQLLHTLGSKACVLGCVLRRANGVTMNFADQLKQLKDATTAGERNFRATFVFFNGTDLSDIDRSRLVQGRMNPRRRNGESYPLHLHPSETGGRKKREVYKSSPAEPTSKRARPDRLQLWNVFKNKYKTLIDMDYRATGMPTQNVLSSMWAQHKSLFGEAIICDDDCKCLERLRKLTRNVFDDYKRSQRKKGKLPEDDVQTAGVVEHFVPRFLPLLKVEYPTSLRLELIQQLVVLWPIHQKHRMYGVRCHMKCECNQAWELIFCKKQSRPRKRKLSSSSNSSSVSNEKAHPNKSEEEAQPNKSEATAEGLGVQSVGSTRRRSLSRNYEFLFSTDDALGAYFVTEAHGVENKCKILSICPNLGQAKRDHRIQPGTIVDSVILDSKRSRVTSHFDLKTKFEEAKRKRSKLRVICVNSEVTSFACVKDVLSQDWDYYGKWQGSNNTGWPGGAHTRNGLVVPDSAGHIPTRPGPSPARSGTERRNVLRTGSSGSIPAHRTRKPSTSVAKCVESPGGTSRTTVQFSDNFVEQLYDADNTATEKLAKVSQQKNGQSNAPEAPYDPVSPKNRFVDIVHTKTCNELVGFLQGGAAPGSSLLREQYQWVKEQLAYVKKDDLDLTAKRTILNIYINSCHAIEKAISMKYWTSFDIRLRHIELHKNYSVCVRGRTNVINGTVTTKFGTILENLGPIPQRPFTEFINFTGKSDLPRYTTNNNSRFLQERRYLVIYIEEGLSTDPVAPIPLATCVIPLNIIDERCPPGGTPDIFSEKIDSSDLLAKGEIQLEIRRCRVSHKYIRGKENETAKCMSDQIDNVIRFNEEHCGPDSRRLTREIQGRDGASLLYAAIMLRQVDLVETLLELPSNPMNKCKHRTSLGLAIKMRDNAKQKLAEASNANIAVSNEEMHSVCQRIVDLLPHENYKPDIDSEISYTSEPSDQLRESSLEPHDDSRLPKFDNVDWLLPPGKGRCHNFDRDGSCQYGLRCIYVHVQPELGDILDDDERFKAKFPECMVDRQLIVKRKGSWYTAGYHEEQMRTYYYAERGPKHKRNDQGIYWYPTRKDAEEGLRRVLIIAKRVQPGKGYAPRCRNTSHFDAGSHSQAIREPNSNDTASWGNQSSGSWGDSSPGPTWGGAKKSSSNWKVDEHGTDQAKSKSSSWGEAPRMQSWGKVSTITSWGDNPSTNTEQLTAGEKATGTPKVCDSAKTTSGKRAAVSSWGETSGGGALWGKTRQRPTWGMQSLSHSKNEKKRTSAENASPLPNVRGASSFGDSSKRPSLGESSKTPPCGEGSSKVTSARTASSPTGEKTTNRSSWGDSTKQCSWGDRPGSQSTAQSQETRGSISSNLATSWSGSSRRQSWGESSKTSPCGEGSNKVASVRTASSPTSEKTSDGASWGDSTKQSSWGDRSGSQSTAQSKGTRGSISSNLATSWGGSSRRPSWGESSKTPPCGEGSSKVASVRTASSPPGEKTSDGASWGDSTKQSSWGDRPGSQSTAQSKETRGSISSNRTPLWGGSSRRPSWGDPSKRPPCSEVSSKVASVQTKRKEESAALLKTPSYARGLSVLGVSNIQGPRSIKPKNADSQGSQHAEQNEDKDRCIADQEQSPEADATAGSLPEDAPSRLAVAESSYLSSIAASADTCQARHNKELQCDADAKNSTSGERSTSRLAQGRSSDSLSVASLLEYGDRGMNHPGQPSEVDAACASSLKEGTPGSPVATVGKERNPSCSKYHPSCSQQSERKSVLVSGHLPKFSSEGPSSMEAIEHSKSAELATAEEEEGEISESSTGHKDVMGETPSSPTSSPS